MLTGFPNLIGFKERYNIKITDPTKDGTYSLCDGDDTFDFKVTWSLKRGLNNELEYDYDYPRIDAVIELDEMVEWFCKRHSDIKPKDAEYCLFWTIYIDVGNKKIMEN